MEAICTSEMLLDFLPTTRSYIKKTEPFLIFVVHSFIRGMRWRSWLRHYATSRKVAGSNPGEVDIFNLPNPFSCTMALESTKPLTEMSTRNILGGKGRPARQADNLTVICEPIV
jgi:hypothetical protein